MPFRSGSPATLEEFLSDFPEGVSDVEAEMATDTYHETHKADARELFRDIDKFLETCASLVAAGSREDPYQSLRFMKFMLERRLERLNKRDDDLRALEAFPTNGASN